MQKRFVHIPFHRWRPDHIRALRAHMGFSQEEFAAEMSVRQQTISYWECAKHEPHPAMHKLLTLLAERAAFHVERLSLRR